MLYVIQTENSTYEVDPQASTIRRTRGHETGTTARLSPLGTWKNYKKLINRGAGKSLVVEWPDDVPHKVGYTPLTITSPVVQINQVA